MNQTPDASLSTYSTFFPGTNSSLNSLDDSHKSCASAYSSQIFFVPGNLSIRVVVLGEREIDALMMRSMNEYTALLASIMIETHSKLSLYLRSKGRNHSRSAS